MVGDDQRLDRMMMNLKIPIAALFCFKWYNVSFLKEKHTTKHGNI